MFHHFEKDRCSITPTGRGELDYSVTHLDSPDFILLSMIARPLQMLVIQLCTYIVIYYVQFIFSISWKQNC